MKISELIDEIRSKDLVLPEFQREYVWTREQAKQLMVSLYRGYPVGGTLFWKTTTPPELKNVDALPEGLGTVSLILDGQQRLTTLYLFVTGEIPPYYLSQDITHEPRDLFFNLGDGDFQYYQASRMKGNPLWCRVVDLLGDSSTVNIFEIVQSQTDEDAQKLVLAERYNNRLQQLRAIQSIDLPAQTVPMQASLSEAIDIFDRVNSQGTKLTDADLALTHVTAKWPTARRIMKEKLDELADRRFYFDLTFMTRALTGVVARRALFETIHGREAAELTDGWNRLSNILDYLAGLLPESGNIHSTEELNSTNVLIPLVVYLSLHDGKFPDDRARKNATHWLYAAHTMARYTAQTDNRLEHDVSLVVRETSPWESLREQIIDQRGRIEVKPVDFEGRGAVHPLYRTTFILAKAMGGIDWFNGMPLSSRPAGRYQLHSHHIFPQAVLYKELYDSSSHLDRKKVNEIANRAFLTADSNISLSATKPEAYLHEVEDRYPGALAKQFIPMRPELWKVDRYEDFLAARRELLATKLNDWMNALITEMEEVADRPIEETIALGESLNREFKSTLQWDVRQNSQNKGLRHSVLKTLAAFMNSEGGTLVVGVEDDGTASGLARDFELVGGGEDKFEQLIASLVADHLGAENSRLISSRFVPVDGETVYVSDVQRAPEPVFCGTGKGKEFFVRVNTTTRSLDPQRAMAYIQTRWG